MRILSPLAPEIGQQIGLLRGSYVRLSLMSVATLSIRRTTLATAARVAAGAVDMVGELSDGSIGVLSLRAMGTDGGAGVEERLLPRLQSALAAGRSFGTVPSQWFWFRSVHRWASELVDADDLIDTLFNTPARPVPIVDPAGILPGFGSATRPALRDSMPRWTPTQGSRV